MVAPLVVALAGATAGSLASNALTKKGDTIQSTKNITSNNTSTRNTTTNTQLTDSRTYSIVYPAYNIQIDSPNAAQTMTKKADAANSVNPAMESYSPANAEGESRGSAATTAGGGDIASLLPYALLAAGGLIVYKGLKK